ncbi:MAG: MotA/TolQ/ExbB proton channel family protein, partial [Verrucomicrobia bacterium]|nr:MotA/TolQ/ExbB proton channel family protein [Verrucomicrobiota bacterium]
MRKRMLKSMIMLISGVILGWGLVFVSDALAQEAAGGGDKKDLSSLSYKDGGPPATFFDYWSQGGPTMWPLLGSLVWTTAVCIELIIKIRFKYFCPPLVVNMLTQAMAVQDYQKAWRIAVENPCPLSSIFSEAIEKLPQGKEAMETIAGEMAANISGDYKIKNAYISLNATIAPLLGLFGTISGMVGAF